MAARRRSFGPLAMLVVLGLLAPTASPTLAQAERPLSSELITADEFTDEQRTRVSAYVEHWVGQLRLENSSAAVAEAQRRLSEPLRNPAGPSQAFLEAYTEPLVAGLDEAMGSEQSISRINATIVLAHVSPEPAPDEVLALLRRGLEDENIAVRYRAAKAAHRIGQRHGWSTAQQVALLEVYASLLHEEPGRLVVRQVMQSLVEFEVADAMERTLEALNQRAGGHQQEPGRTLDPEHAALEQLFRHLLQADGADAASADIRELSRTGYRYVRLAAEALEQQAVPEEHVPAYREVIGLGDQILHEAHSQLEVAQTPPDRASVDLERGDWAAILEKAEEWGAVLQESPFNFSAGELALGPGDGS